MIKIILERFCGILKIILGALMAFLSVPVAMQVISRYTGIIPTYLWTEELATFTFVWVVMIGSMVAVWEGTHFDVAITKDAQTPTGILLQKGIVLICVLIFSLLFFWYGIEYAKIGSIQTSVMMKANLLWIYISVPIAGFIWTIFTAYRLCELFINFRNSKRGLL